MYNEINERRIIMKRLIVSLLVITALVFSACAETANNTSSSTPEIDASDVFDTSGINKYPIISNEGEIKLPEGVFYSLEIGKDYRERLSQYSEITDNGKGIGCFVWLDSGELKFGIKPLADIDNGEELKKSLPAATLGEIGSILYGYGVARRKGIKLLVLDDALNGYENELSYLVGIGENCLEYRISIGSYRFDKVFCGAEAIRLYEYVGEAHKNAERLTSVSDLNENCESGPKITISFAPSGSGETHRIWNEYGSYTFYANGCVCYSPSIAASYCERLRFSEKFYGEIYSLARADLKANGIKYPIAQPDELWCSAQIGLYADKEIITGINARDLLAFAKEMSNSAKPCGDRSDVDYEKTIYIEFYNGEMEILSEFTVYPDEFCGLFSESPFLNRKYGVLPAGSYNRLLEYIENTGVDKEIAELLSLLKKQGIKVGNKYDYLNVTPERVKRETDYRIFKNTVDFASYIVVDGNVYEICHYLGGFGFSDAFLCDFDNNGVLDLIGCCSWGSGVSRSEVFYFDMNDKSSSVVYSTLNYGLSGKFDYKFDSWMMVLDIEGDENKADRFGVYMHEISPISSVIPEKVKIGEIVAKDGKPVLVPEK